MLQILDQVIYRWRAKQWYINFTSGIIKKNEYAEFLFEIYKYLKISLFQCQGVVMILEVGIAKTG